MISGTRTLFNWSLKSDAQAFSPHIVRLGFSGFMLLAILAAWADSLGGIAPGLNFFDWICRLNVLLISVSGISYFVSAVTEEKDSGSLALLRLAGVSPLAIILSKSTSRLISSLMLLLIQLPFTFLAITLGGIRWQQIIASYLALAAWMCLVANGALFCSVRCRTSGRAATFASALLLGFFAAGPVLRQVATLNLPAEVIQACRGLYEEQQLMSVVTRLDVILRGKVELTILSTQFWRNVVAGGGLFLLSVLLFNRYSDPTEMNPHGKSARVRRFTVGRCWRLPLVWKDYLFFNGGSTIMVLKSILYVGVVLAFAWFHNLQSPRDAHWLSDKLLRNAFSTVGGLLTVEMLLYASNTLFMEARQSSIAALRMLPYQTPVVLLQKVAACALALLPGVLILFLLFMYRPNVFTSNSGLPELFVLWLFFALLSTHLTVLLSLYTKWAALPIAVAVSTVSTPCIGGAAAVLARISADAAALNGISWGIWFAALVNLVWMWLFVLLPIEIEIVNRWNRLSRDS